MKKIGLLVFYMVCSLVLSAQQNETADFYLPIDRIENTGDALRIHTKYGKNLGIERKMPAEIWGIHLQKYPNRYKSPLAKGQVEQVSDSAAVVLIDKKSDYNIIQEDMVGIILPAPDVSGLFTRLIQRNVYFRGQNGERIYDFATVFNKENETLQNRILTKMKADIKAVAGNLDGTMNNQDTIQSGLYQGMDMLQAMQRATVRDVLSFMYYVDTYPRQYMSKDFKISETFATWAINGTPLVLTDIKDLLSNAKSETDYQQIANKYSNLISNDNVLDLGLEAEDMVSNDDLESANVRMAKVLKLSKYLEDPQKKAWAHFQQARVMSLDGRSEVSAGEYQKAIRFFEEAGHNYGLTYAYNNLGSQYDDLGDYARSEKAYQKSVAAREQQYENIQSTENLKRIGAAYYYLAYAQEQLQKYELAIENYENSKKAYAEAGSSDEVLKRLSTQAEVYGKWGKIDKAIEILEQRKSLADSLNKPVVAADVIFDMGYTYNGYGDQYEKAIPYYQQSYDMHMALGDTSMAALSLSNVAQSYWSLKNLDASIENHLATIELAEAFGEKDRIANSWDKLADLYSENGNPKKSLEAYDRVLELYQELDDDRLVETLNEIGDVYKDAKDYREALTYYKRSMRASRAKKDYVSASDALFDIADAFYTQNQYDSAEKYYIASMKEAARTHYPSQEIYCLANLGLIYGIKNDYEKSDDIYAEALRKAKELGDDNIIAFCKYRLAGTATRKLNYDKAENLYREALSMYKELNDQSMQVSLLYALSWMHSNRGDFDKAIELIDRGIQISKENSDRIKEATGYNSKSDLYLRIKGEFDKAMDIQRQSMQIFKEVDNVWGIAQSNTGLGNIKNLMGENVEAIRYYSKADSMYKKLGDNYSRATPINNMGTIYFAQADYEKALKYFHGALEILDSLEVKDSFRTLIVANIGEVKLEQKAYKEAEKWLLQSLEEAREINNVDQISTSLVLMGRLKIETEAYKKAENYLKRAINLQKEKGLKTHEIATNLSLGKLAYLRENKKGYDFLDECIRLSQDMEYEKELWEAYYYKGLIAKEAGKLEESKELFINAIEAMEELQSNMVGGDEAKKRFASGDKQVKVYSSLIDVLIMKGEVELGMQYLERGNTEALRNKFKQLDITFKDEEANEKLKKERKLKRKLDNLERAITEEKSADVASSAKIQKLKQNMSVAEDEYLKFVNRTIQTDPKLAQHFSGGFHPRNLKTDKNRRLIPDELVVLSYLPGNDKLYIFAATSDTVIAKIVQVSVEELNKNIKFLHNFASHAISGHNTDQLRVARGDGKSTFEGEFNDDHSPYKEVSEKLFNWVVAPVQQQLDAKEKVVVIPTGMLHFLPFQMLGEQKPNGKFDYLIEHYTLFYAHSLNMLYQRRPRDPEVSILAMANADRSLPAAEQEAKNLKALYPDTDVYLHDSASEDKAKSHNSKHNILHFATHGNLDYYDYHKSYLTLAPSEKEDGKLTIEEVWEIEDIYSYQMVTLSACKTAVADGLNTGWAVSPATSFIDAGAPTVVASLWAVNDASTGILMKYFYENLDSMSKVEALRRAQIKLSQHEEFSHPYYWAPFILIGDWR